MIGPNYHGSAFESDAERREAWRLHGAEVATWGNYIPGTRCWAWWEYESPEPRGIEDWDELAEAQHLRRMGVLSEQEIRDFEAFRGVSIGDLAPSDLAREYNDSIGGRGR